MAKRRGRNEGSVFRQHDPKTGRVRWCGQVDVGRGPTGKRRRLRVYGDTREAVHEDLVDLLKKQHDGDTLSAERLSIGQFLDRWLADVKPNVRPRTYESYAGVVETHLRPAFGSVQVKALTKHQVREFMSGKRAEGLAPRTVAYLRSILRMALRDAVDRGLTTHNAAAEAKPPRVPAYRVHPLSLEDARAFLRAAATHRQYPLWLLTLSSGLRMGEALAVRWQDLDLEQGRLSVRHTLQVEDGEAVLREPKTDRSKRTIPIAPVAVEALRTHKRHQAEDRLAAGADWSNPLGLCFTTQTGAPLDRNNVRHAFQRVLKAAKLPAQRFHDLRHAAASYLLAEGIPALTVAELLGHSNTRTTLNVYGHCLPLAAEQASGTMDRLLRVEQKAV